MNDAVLQGYQKWGAVSTLRPEEANEESRFQKPERKLYGKCHMTREFSFKRSLLPAERTV